MIKAISYTLLITSVLICSCNTNTNNNAEIKDTVNSSDAINTLKEGANGIKGDSLLYDTDEGFNHVEANKAEAFVLKTFKIDKQKTYSSGVWYNKNDGGYTIRITIDNPKNEATHSTYYIYYPLTQTILDGMFYDTLYHNQKMYPEK